MVIDTSALAAIIFGEPDADRFLDALIDTEEGARLSAANAVEIGIVVEARHGTEGTRDLELLLDRTSVEIMAVDSDQVALAVGAWRRFGKGRHPAALNLGDCFAYALTTVLGEPLLFKGGDFAATDVAAVLT